MMYNEGDFVAIGNGDGEVIAIGILAEIKEDGRIITHADIPVLCYDDNCPEDEKIDEDDWEANMPNFYCGDAEVYRMAREDEKEELIAALKEEGVRWDDEKKMMVEIEKE